MISLTDVVKLWDEIPGEGDGGPYDFKDFVEMVDRSLGVYNDVVLINGED